MTLDHDSERSRIVSPRAQHPKPRGSVFGSDGVVVNDDKDTIREGQASASRQSSAPGRSSTAGHRPLPGAGQLHRIGRFTVLKLLGQGGMGYVYSCYDEQLDRKIAVKVLRPALLCNQKSATTRLMREAQAMARLAHPNVVTVFEAGEADQLVFVAMEFISGTSLDVWVASPRSWKEVLSTFIQAGRGLAAAHQVGIVHRDFKPQNVMRNEDGIVKVLDFGLARAADGNVSEELFTTSPDTAEAPASPLLLKLTYTGTILGTPAYMSPEQHSGEVANAASDQFSFCVSLYQALYTRLPFSIDSLEALKGDVMRGAIAPPPARTPVPARIHGALRRGMHVDPAQRFKSMTELLAVLERDPARRLWRAATVVGTAAITGVVSISAVGANAVEVCPDAHAELAGIWDAERRSSVEASVRATAPGQAGELLLRVEPRLDDYAAAWSAMRNESCIAHAEGRQSAQLFDQRTACLDQRRASLAATVDAVANAESTRLDNAIKAVLALPALETCADVDALTAEIPPPEDPAVRTRVQQHRQRLARAEVLEATGQTLPGLELVHSVFADAEALAYRPLFAEAHLRKGSLQMRDDAPAALRSFNEAMNTALEIGHTRVAAHASARRGYVLAESLSRAKDAQEDLPWVSALNRRTREDTVLYKDHLISAEVVLMRAGDTRSAKAMLIEATQLAGRNGKPKNLQDLIVLNNFSSLLRYERHYGESMELLERALVLSEDLFGPLQTADRVMFESNRAANLVELGRPREALSVLSKIQRAAESGGPWTKFAVDFHIKTANASLDNFTSEGPVMNVVRDIGPVEPHPEVWGSLMYLAAREGDVAGMKIAYEKAQAGREQNEGSEGSIVLDHGRALAALGRHREAVEVLEQARSELVRSERSGDRVRSADLSLELGKSRRKLGEYDVAERELIGALIRYQQLLSPHNLELAEAMLALGELALEQRRFARAAKWLSRAESVYRTTAESDYPPLTRTRAALAEAQAGR